MASMDLNGSRPEALCRQGKVSKSPSTIMKRANSLLSFYIDEFLPLKEPAAWAYLQRLMQTNAAPTTASSCLDALRFSQYVLQIHGASTCIESR